MDETACRSSRAFDRACSRTYAAWERFAAGQDDASGVPLSIALSWHRCRDVYRIDPVRARPETVDGDAPARLVHGRVLAELGALARTLLVAGENRLVTVSDGGGVVMASWGRGAAERRAPEAGLVPCSAWSEPATGTNAIGTAIVQRHACVVRGPEHWSPALHGWSCTGIVVNDPTTAAPLATLAVSSWREMVTVRPIDLLLATAPLSAALQETASRHGQRIVEAFTDLERQTTGALVALDLRGRIVAANDAARRRGAVPGDYAGEPPMPSREGIGSLGNVIPDARARAREDPGWRGAVSVWSAITDDVETYRVIPVVAGADPIAFLASTDDRAGRVDILDRPGATSRSPREGPRRIPALGAGGQIVVLHPQEIRYARSDGHVVWLVTDQGPLRASVRGIDHVEQELAGAGFLRVHRCYLVNIGRVRDVAAVKDRLVISTGPDGERVPVSRRHVPSVREALGM